MSTSTTSRLVAAALLAAVTAGMSGCMISRSKTEFTGSYIAAETVRQIEAGESQASVMDLLGPPSSKADLGSSVERWAWRWSKTRRSSDRVLLLSSSRQEVEETGTVWVEFEHGVVTSAWRQ